jgi:hypothetical protein
MTHPLVFASSTSRLHADLVIVRLKRAGIPPSYISLIHPLASCPNSAECWLGGSAQLRLSSGEEIAASGFLRRLLEDAGTSGTSPHSLDENLANLGLAHERRLALEETLLENRVVIAVDVVDRLELPTILQTLHRSGAEKIFATEVNRSTRRKLVSAA